MEYLLVTFREDRQVIVDGHVQGLANTVIELEAGQHQVCLDAPYDYSPSEYLVTLAGTTVLSPHEISFA